MHTAANPKVLFGLGLEAGVHQVSEMLGHARLADDAGLDIVSVSDHPYFAERVDAYAVLGFVLGATSNITGAVIMTNLLSRPAPILARTITGLSTLSGGRVVLGLGAGGMWEEIIALGVPRRRRRSGHVRRRVLPRHRADARGRTNATDLDRIARPKGAGGNRTKRGRMDTRAPRRLAQHAGGRVTAARRRSGCFGRERP